jgi:hypothetical protein
VRRSELWRAWNMKMQLLAFSSSAVPPTEPRRLTAPAAKAVVRGECASAASHSAAAASTHGRAMAAGFSTAG